MIARGILAVMRFEAQRSRTPTRIAVWVALTLFPAALMTVMHSTDFEPPDPRVWTFFLTLLCCGVVTLLGLLLWAAPLIQSELEANTWVYAAVRPNGRTALLWGKYLVAVVWSLSASWASLLLAFPIAQPPEFFHTLWVLAWLSLWTAVGFGAAYALISVLFHRRSMALCLAYTLVFEILVSMIPAVINQLTLQYRLRCLMVGWLGWDEASTGMPAEMKRFLFGEQSPWMHVVSLCLMTIALLAAATYVTRNKELVTTDE